MKVTLLERECFPRHAPGESLHPGVQPLLRQLGVEQEVLDAGFVRYPGHVVRWGDAERLQLFGEDTNGPWLGFHAWRPTFDAILLKRARCLGVAIEQPITVNGVRTNGEKVSGVNTEHGPIHADLVIDGTGRWRAVSRWLRLKWQRSGPTRIAWYGYATGPSAKAMEVPSLRADNQGWTWIANVQANTYTWTRHNFNNAKPAEDWQPSELAEMTPTGTVRGADVTWQVAERPAGDGYFLVGDAAATFDPTASHGVLKALMSGIYAGQLAAYVLGKRVPAEFAASRYSAWVHEWFSRDVARLNELYSLLPDSVAAYLVAPKSKPK